jgi:hypothetical protein
MICFGKNQSFVIALGKSYKICLALNLFNSTTLSIDKFLKNHLQILSVCTFATFDVPRGVGSGKGPKGMVILRITFINIVCQHNLLCVIVVITRMVEAFGIWYESSLTS